MPNSFYDLHSIFMIYMFVVKRSLYNDYIHQVRPLVYRYSLFSETMDIQRALFPSMGLYLWPKNQGIQEKVLSEHLSTSYVAL